jgi:putative DNA primase/helicase
LQLSKGTYRRRCPVCGRGSRDRTLAVKIDDFGAVWHCHRCGLDDWVRRSSASPVARYRCTHDHDQHHRRKRQVQQARQILAASETIEFTPAQDYLAARAIYEMPNRHPLRFHSSVYHWPSKTQLPAMLAPITNTITNELQGLHVTFIAEDGRGKAPVETPRLYLGPKSGGVVKLSPDEEITLGLGIAEGIETALSCPFRPIWACLDAGNLAAFPVLTGIEALTIFADNDTNGRGRRSAEEVVRRWQAVGREVRAVMPAEPGLDCNDLLRAGALRG